VDLWRKGIVHIRHCRITSTGYEAGILSAASSHIPESADQKRLWLSRELPQVREDLIKIVADKTDKPAFAAPGEILIDDYISNIEPWREAGGIGIHFQNAIQTVEELQTYIKADPFFYGFVHSAMKDQPWAR
jgi:5'(3')-deoxyribonucleotidase